MTISPRESVGMFGRAIFGSVGTAQVILGALVVQGAIGLILILLSTPLLLTAMIGFCHKHVASGTTASRNSMIAGPGDMKENDEIMSAGIETLWLMPRGEFDRQFGSRANRTRA